MAEDCWNEESTPAEQNKFDKTKLTTIVIKPKAKLLFVTNAGKIMYQYLHEYGRESNPCTELAL